MTASNGHNTPSRSVFELDGFRRAEHQVDARDGEHKDQSDQARQARARQVHADIEVTEILLEQTAETQARETALELVRERRAETLSVELG